MNLKKILKLKLPELTLGVFLMAAFVPFLEYQNRCLLPPCEKTLRTIAAHATNNVPIEGINFVFLTLGLLGFYIFSVLLFHIFRKIKKNKKFKC